MKHLFHILILSILCSCKSNTPEASSAPGTEKFFEINYENILKNTKVIPLSQIATNVEYIKLETNNDCVIRRITDCLFTDSLIFVANMDHILKFSREGKFLQKIGKPGRGPGEIDLIRTMSILPEHKMIAVQKNYIREMLYLSFDGTVVRTVKIPRALYIKVMYDGRSIAYDAGVEGTNKNTFSLISEKGDTISSIRNYCNWINNSEMQFMAGSFPVPFISGKSWFFKDRYNDTVYTVSSNKIIPCYTINLGKYKLPDELRLERLGPERIPEYKAKAPYYYHTILFEAADKIFIRAECYGDGDNKYIIYDKADRTGTLLNSDSGSSEGFINDLDGGPDFWPAGIVNDNQVYQPLDMVTLKKEFEKKSGEPGAKYPDKKIALEKLISDSKDTDNPVLMIVTLKSR